MQGHISISLTGDSIPSLQPIGCSINYGINMVPIATVDLDASHLALLCDFESVRRSKVTLAVDTVEGCLTFDGLIDDLSFRQSAGSIQASLVIKNEYQRLMELFPRLPGFHPGTETPFTRLGTVNFNPNGGDPGNFLPIMDVAKDLSIKTSDHILKFFTNAMRATLIAQQNTVISATVGTDVSDLIQVSAEFANTLIPLALPLIDAIDTSAVDKLIIKASDAMVVTQVLKDLQEATGTLLEDFMLKLSNYGCALVIANKKAFIVPESGFLNIPHNFNVPVGGESVISNVIYPAQYESFNFNGGGYKDIKAVYLVSDESTTTTNADLQVDLGRFIDHEARGGLLSLSLPKFVALGIDYEIARGARGVTDKLQGRIPNTAALATQQNVADQQVENSEESIRFSNKIREEYTNNWAQMKYCQVKYTDRTGTISSVFNPNWAPGAVGTLYTRLPGTFLDFFVTAVSHNFGVSIPNSGTATTTISFNCGRIGKGIGSAGLDKIDLFDYTYDDALAYSDRFVADVTAV